MIRKIVCFIVGHDWHPEAIAGPSWPYEDDEKYTEVCFRCNITRD